MTTDPSTTAQDQAPIPDDHPTACVGRGAHGRCPADPKWSVSEYVDQRTDYRVCGRHLSWFVDYLNDKGKSVVVVARLVSGGGPSVMHDA